MSSKPSIVRRVGIAWGGVKNGNFEEPTSTLILSTPGQHFVDIRLILNTPRLVSTDGRNNPALSHPYRFELGVLYTGLEWAIAGKSSYEPSKTTPATHGTWTHWIDNRTTKPGKDEGDMVTRDDGSTLEMGWMVNPATGEEGYYEEVWMTEVFSMATQDRSVRPRKQGSYVYVEGEDKSKEWKAAAIWVGRYCQGIVRKGDEVTVERWQWDETGRGGLGEWVRTWRTGNGVSACGWLVSEAEEVQVGMKLNVPDLEHYGGDWIVKETDFEW